MFKRKPRVRFERTRGWILFSQSKSIAPQETLQGPDAVFSQLRDAYAALEFDPDNTFLHVAFLKARRAWMQVGGTI